MLQHNLNGSGGNGAGRNGQLGASGYGMCAKCGGTVEYREGMKQCKNRAYDCKG